MEIRYTGNKAAGLSPQRSVLFFYEKRSDAAFPGASGLMTKRLSKLATKVGKNLVKEYRFAYEYSPATLRSRLTSLRECDDIGNCLSPTVFEWENGILELDKKEIAKESATSSDQPPPAARMIDINGDARPDYVYGRPNVGEYWAILNEDNSFDTAKTWRLTRCFDALKLIVNGLGSRVAIRYKPVAENPENSKATDSSRARFEPPLYVVSQHTISDGRGAAYTVKRRYAGLKIDRRRGSASFAEIRVINQEEDRETVGAYHQDFPLAGMIKRKIETTALKIPRSQSDYFYETRKNERGVFQVNPTIATSRENGRDRRLEYQYDDAGRLIMKLDSRDKARVSVHTCYAYEDHTGDDWWKSRFVAEEKISADREACLNPDFNVWKTRSDIRLRRFVHDSKMNVVSRRIWNNIKNKWIKTGFAYDAYGNVVRKTDPQGWHLVITYDNKFRSFPIEKRIGQFAIGLEYEPKFGLKVRETDFNGNTVEWIPPVKIDGFGRVMEVLGSQPEDESLVVIRKTVVSRGENNNGLKTTVYARADWDKENQEDWIWETKYRDALGRVYKIENKADEGKVIVRRKEFDRQGRVVKESAPYYRPESRPSFDKNIPGSAMREPLSGLADRENRVWKNESGFGPDVEFSDLAELNKVDFANNLFLSLFETESTGEAAKHKPSIGFANNLLSLARSASKIETADVELKRDSAGQIISIFKAGSKITFLTYTDGGLAETATDAEGQVISFFYDSLGRVVEKRLFAAGGYPENPRKIINYTYDRGVYALGKLTAVSSPEATVDFAYDRLGRIKSRTAVISDPDAGGQSFVVKYSRDSLGRPVEIVYPDNSTLRYLYTPGGKVHKVQLKEADEERFSSCLTYEARAASGDIKSLAYGNGLNFSHTYDSPGRLTGNNVFRAGETLFALERHWNKHGEPTGVIDNNRAAPYFLSRGFSYDSKGRPRSAVGSYFNKFYEYDARGNIVGTGEFPKSSPLKAGFLNRGVAVKDAAVGVGYLMYSREIARERFSSHPPHPHNADHFIAVFYQNGEWKYSDNSARLHPFAPRSGDILVARFDFDAEELTDLKGQNSFLAGVAYGYAGGDLSFHYNRWNNESNKGEFYLTGNKIVSNAEFIEAVPSAVAALGDSASGLGYLMYSRKNLRERFFIYPPHRENSDHFIAVAYRNGKWKYNDGRFWRVFTPRKDDILIAEADFKFHSFIDLKGKSGNFGGLAYGYADGDFIFSSNRNDDNIKLRVKGNGVPNIAGAGKRFHYDAEKQDRIIEIRDNSVRKIEYDANGNITAKGAFRYSYDIEGRLIKVDKKVGEDLKPVYEFIYDPLGGRLGKIEAGGAKTFYPTSLYETSVSFPEGSARVKYIAGSMAVGKLANGKTQVRYFYGDPRDGAVIVSDDKGRLVNSLIYDPYGKIVCSNTVEGDFSPESSLFGYDSKAGLHYWEGRYYDYEIGAFLNFNFLIPAASNVYMETSSFGDFDVRTNFGD